MRCPDDSCHNNDVNSNQCYECGTLQGQASNQEESGNTAALDLANHLDRVGMITDGCSINDVVERINALPSGKTNNASPKLPTLDKCYKAIPFPENEPSVFVAGLAAMYKFIVGNIQA